MRVVPSGWDGRLYANGKPEIRRTCDEQEYLRDLLVIALA